MSRRVVITGLGPVSALGQGVGPTWESVIAGRAAVAPIAAFDATGFAARIAGEVRDFDIKRFVPKSYRKATKVMARDIELAVAAADFAARDAGLATKGTDPDAPPSYDPQRVGAHIGAGLIAAEVNELTAALAESTDTDGAFSFHKWGREGMTHLTPLWLLKYLPNMLACHVTIIHDAQGPSNTITCNEASATLSIGESLRVIQRGQADACFCGGADSKVNPMGLLRQIFTGLLNTDSGDQAEASGAVRPFCTTARGSAVAEGGGIVILEAIETFQKRSGARAYAEVIGFGASQTVNPAGRNITPDAQGRGIANAVRAALREANVEPDAIDLIVPFGIGAPQTDQAEAAALRTVFGARLAEVPIVGVKAMAGNCAAGSGGLDVCVAAKALAEQTIPAVVNCSEPLPGLKAATAPATPAPLRHALVYSTGLGGQNAALVLKRFAD
jgi:3-oxoacyl-[acyl-carrier-protein] synthase II